jgi:beta-xylosidase
MPDLTKFIKEQFATEEDAKKSLAILVYIMNMLYESNYLTETGFLMLCKLKQDLTSINVGEYNKCSFNVDKIKENLEKNENI